jgi:hypothetical protein
MEQWWNDTDRGKLKYWEKTLSQCHIVHDKSLAIWPGIELGPLRLKANTYQNYI